MSFHGRSHDWHETPITQLTSPRRPLTCVQSKTNENKACCVLRSHCYYWQYQVTTLNSQLNYKVTAVCRFGLFFIDN